MTSRCDATAPWLLLQLLQLLRPQSTRRHIQLVNVVSGLWSPTSFYFSNSAAIWTLIPTWGVFNSSLAEYAGPLGRSLPDITQEPKSYVVFVSVSGSEKTDFNVSQVALKRAGCVAGSQ